MGMAALLKVIILSVFPFPLLQRHEQDVPNSKIKGGHYITRFG